MFFWDLNSLKMALGVFDFNDAYVLRVKMKSKPAIKMRSTNISHMNPLLLESTRIGLLRSNIFYICVFFSEILAKRSSF